MNKSRAFRFGFLTGGAASRKAWIDKARRAEDLGYATLLIDDHLQIDLHHSPRWSVLRMQQPPCGLEALSLGMIFVIPSSLLKKPPRWIC